MTFRYGYVRHGYHRYGKGDPVYRGHDSPWYVTLAPTLGANVRADGLSAEGSPSPIRPGQTVTYTLAFMPQRGRGFGANEHVDRYRRARSLLIRADDVVTYGEVPGDEVRYREQHDAPGGTQLVRIGPLDAQSNASAPAGAPPPGRDSIHEPRWAVVTGGGTETSRPEKGALLQLQTVTIAPASDFPKRSALRAAREVNSI
ncbi:hypothetical protein C2R22_05890 [Salinigranum rubrum]|uniref:Uncharacterized protein n=1 Tax=Salinigranum rubrum TaxID=755307 RepID=A0A2I8VJL4_9EURY|nr:hypothetical protein [Salinigranum rubrum]AUV81249.1 hypothetical protein C2R22_05890 [Salinigranum rubrum]